MFLLMAAMWFGCGDPCASPFALATEKQMTSGGLNMTRTVLDAGVCGPAFATTGDLNGDGHTELLVSWFGHQDGPSIPNGGLNLYDFSAGLDAAAMTQILQAEDNVKWPNAPHLGDVDADGDDDILVGLGFLTCLISPYTATCGGLLGFENRDGAFHRFDVVPPGDELFFHSGLLADMDGDGIDDIVTVGESIATPFGHTDRAETQWYRGQGGGQFDAEPRIVGEGLGSLPVLLDIDGDGDIDIAGAEFFRADAATFAWFEQVSPPTDTDPAGVWTRHVIADAFGPAIQLSAVPDATANGGYRFFGANHVNNAPDETDPMQPVVTMMTPGDDPTQPWEVTVIADDFQVMEAGAGVGAPGIFGHGDVDGDGDEDLLLSGDGDAGVYWLEQTDPGIFVQHVLEPDLTQAGAMIIEDLDNDGQNELVVSGYDDNVIFVYNVEAP